MTSRPRLAAAARTRPTGRGVGLGVALALLATVGLPGRRLVAQELGPGQDPAEGKLVEAVVVEGARARAARDRVLRALRTKVGSPFRASELRRDLEVLWSDHKIQALAELEDGADGNSVRVILTVREFPAFDRVRFLGLDHFKEDEVFALLGIAPRQRLTSFSARTYLHTLEERYRRDGFYFVDIQLVEDEQAGVLTFRIDEGPRVRVRSLEFRGNEAFPDSTFLGLGDNLVGSSGMKSTGSFLGIFNGAPFSMVQLEEDLEALRVFYRGKGYRNARVELAERHWDEDRNEVDLVFQVVEGRRWRIRDVRVEHDALTGDAPLYPPADVLEELRVRRGQYYDRDRIDRDLARIRAFYGERGHPTRQYGASIPQPFDVAEPEEVFDLENAELDLIFRITEGTPKRLRDVVISGNTYTRDRVIRRQLRLLPGERLDMVEVDRAQQRLDALRYFEDKEQLTGGVLFELQPVPGSEDEVDLAIQVREGDTGSLMWGAGISSGFGIQGRIQFLKRNFDAFALPSSPNPLTFIPEIIESKAFHGGGQTLDMSVAPGTEVSLFQITWYEPDIFRRHFDTIGLRLQGFRQIRRLDSFDSDTLGGVVSLDRRFGDVLSAALSLRQETVDVENLDANAPTIVFDAEGSNELRGMRLNLNLSDVDNLLAPTSGYRANAYGEVVGGPFGADVDFWKAGASAQLYLPLAVDLRERATVLDIRTRFDYGQAFGSSDDVFVTERFYMGGSNLRGFDQRRAGPVQFGAPLGGEARLLGTSEMTFPLFSTRLQGRVRELEILRGAVFADVGMLGLTLDHPTFREPRLAVGVGVRIQIPYLGIPLQIDFGWPLIWEETDDRRQVYFTLSR